MYIPRHWHFALPVTTILFGFYIGHRFYPDWLAVLAQVGMTIVAVPHALYIWQAGVIYQKYLAHVDAEQKEIDAAHGIGKPSTPILRTNGEVYAQVVSRETINKERQLANTLLHMQKHGKVDLREEKWVKTTRMFTRAEFVAVRDKWEKRSIVAKSAGRSNAPYEVIDWRAMQLIAQGNL